MVLLFCLVLFYKPQTHVNKILFKCLNPYRSRTRVVNIINPFFPQPDHELISVLPFSVSQYELAMPPKVCPLKLEWWLTSYTHFMVRQLSVYLASVTLAEESRKGPSLSSNCTSHGYRKETPFGAHSLLFLFEKFSCNTKLRQQKNPRSETLIRHSACYGSQQHQVSRQTPVQTVSRPEC